MSSSTALNVPPATAPSSLRGWQTTTAPYRVSSIGRAVIQLCTTILPLAALVALMYAMLDVSYWITLALALPAAGFLVRTFIIMHDCGHGSFVPSRRANEVIGFITGAITLTPFAQWRRDHALHHASSGDLDRRGHGDVLTLTVDEYLARSRWGRFKYRLYRHPITLFVLGPIFLLVVRHLPAAGIALTTKTKIESRATTAAIVAIVVAFALAIGWKAVLLVYGPILLIAGATGNWLFYVQHQFEDTYWEPHEGWDYAEAAIKGASYYRLPRVLEWMTGRIGLHHVHHLDPKIPNYHLRRCHDENGVLQAVTVLTIRESIRTASLKLWDAEHRRMVGFPGLRAGRAAA
ncbi:MAG TPA: fatty acid desaturase [Gemmatimonadaceae bacterium]|nr:fatty acid desaturase [Gemmatimonadaceae bacterium]